MDNFGVYLLLLVCDNISSRDYMSWCDIDCWVCWYFGVERDYIQAEYVIILYKLFCI